MHMRQVVAYKRLKMMENYKTVRPKRGHNHLREVVAHGSSTVLLGQQAAPLPPPLEKHINCSIYCLVLYV